MTKAVLNDGLSLSGAFFHCKDNYHRAFFSQMGDFSDRTYQVQESDKAMRSSIFTAGVILSVCIGVLAYSQFDTNLTNTGEQNTVRAAKEGKTMPAFSSEEALKAKLKANAARRRGSSFPAANSADGAGITEPAATMSAAESKSSADSRSTNDETSITNTQTAGVDEGGIVKVHGDHLVILRRGRLFTVKVGDGDLNPVSNINAYPPKISPSGDWYDEMLISGDTVIVVGYSYSRGGTEINLFDISPQGSLAYRSTYHLRSNDYYSSRNYASRLIGTKLIFYTPQYLGYSDDPMRSFPAIRRWHSGAQDSEFRSVVPATRVYHPAIPDDELATDALHTVTVCDLASREMRCQGTAVLGGAGRVFYMSQNSVYVWTTEQNHRDRTDSRSMLYRMPLDGSAPSAIQVAGAPVDQFSFFENDNEQLNVVVRSDGRGDQMWNGEYSIGDVALFRVSTDSFSDGSSKASIENYRSLPKPEGYTFQNRFVGDYVLYGTGNGWSDQRNRSVTPLYAVNWHTATVTFLNVEHSVDRIEPLGNAAVVVGINGNDLYFSPVRLGRRPELRTPYVRPNASQGELRSHGFFYKPDDDNNGMLGLPIARQGRAGYRHLIENSAAIIFLRNKGLNFDEMGELEARTASTNDGCRASCIDWYGNARPIFLRGRIFALLGYEIVEGRLSDGRLLEKQRVNYSPRGFTAGRGEYEE